MKIVELAKLYIRERTLSDTTVVHYGYVADIFVRDAGVQEIREVDRDVLLNWRETTLARDVSESTWNNYLRHMKVLFCFAFARSLIPALPENMSGLLMQAHIERPKTVSSEDLKKVMAHVSGRHSKIQPGWYWAILLRTLFYTGMRRRQLTELKWCDINLEKNTIRLRAESSKNRRGWEIPIVANLKPSLERLRERTLKVLGENTDISSRYAFDISLFSRQYRSCKGGQMCGRTVSNFFSRVRFATGINISAHMLRHTMATELAQQGLYKELQCILGHTDVQMTMRYVHPEIEQLRTLAEHLESIDQ